MAEIDEIDNPSFADLADATDGDLLHPGDEGYDEARSIFNGMIDKYPAAILRSERVEDVVASVDFAREHDILLSVKGGGHNFSGKAVCDDGLMIDMSLMDDVEVDPEQRIARVGPGTLLKDLDEATQAHGLAVTAGVYSETGVAGLTLGGGIGWLMRKYGLTCDNLLAAEVVTANGEVVRASESDHPDLFWGLRGGGGNFGVITEFEFQLHPVGPEVLTAQIFHPGSTIGDGLRFFREFMADAPDDFTCFPMVLTIPPMEPFPAEHQGKPGLAFVGCWAGDPGEGRDALAPLETWGEPIMAVVDEIPYVAFQSAFDEGQPPGMRYYGKSAYVEELSDDLIDVVVEQTADLPSPITNVWFESMGGAVARIDPTETAFPHRNAAYNLGIVIGWSDPDDDDAMMDWARSVFDAVRPHTTEGVYANYLDQGDEDQVVNAFGENYERLIALKNTWDPTNLFRLNQNVSPSA